MADFFDDNDNITEDISSLSSVLFAHTLNIPLTFLIYQIILLVLYKT